jgi:hypothetical protein
VGLLGVLERIEEERGAVDNADGTPGDGLLYGRDDRGQTALIVDDDPLDLATVPAAQGVLEVDAGKKALRCGGELGYGDPGLRGDQGNLDRWAGGLGGPSRDRHDGGESGDRCHDGKCSLDQVIFH